MAENTDRSLEDRLREVFMASAHHAPATEPPPWSRITRTTIRPTRSRWLIPAAVAAAVVILVGAAGVIALTRGNGQDPAAPPAPAPGGAAPCTSVDSILIHVGYTSTQPSVPRTPPTEVEQSGHQYPAHAMYISGGPAGTGLLCWTSEYDQNPIVEKLGPEDRPIAYLGQGPRGNRSAWGGVAPGVAAVTVESSGDAGTTIRHYSASPSADRQFFTDGGPVVPMDALGDGWNLFHELVQPAGSTGRYTATVTAYDADHRVLDTRTISTEPSGTATTPSGADANCTSAESKLAPFGMGTGGASAERSGRDRPANGFFTSGGPPGKGILCWVIGSGASAIVETLEPLDGPIGYLGFTSSDEPVAWGAVGPGVTSVTLRGAGANGTATFSSPTSEMGDLGDGWHVFHDNTLDMAGQHSTTVIAYDAQHRVVAERTISSAE